MKTYSKNCKTRKPDGMEKKKPQKKAMGGMAKKMKEGGEVPRPRPRPSEAQLRAPSRSQAPSEAQLQQAMLQRRARMLVDELGISMENAMRQANQQSDLNDKEFQSYVDSLSSTKQKEGMMYGGMAKKKMAKGGKLKMVEKDGKKVPFYAADGKGKMMYGGMAKKKA
jgi:hypothetical protein